MYFKCIKNVSYYHHYNHYSVKHITITHNTRKIYDIQMSTNLINQSQKIKYRFWIFNKVDSLDVLLKHIYTLYEKNQ